MKTYRNIALGILAFIVAAIIVGQIIMYGQGDTAKISMLYGLLYVVWGCGILDIPKMIQSGEFHLSLIIAVLFEFIVGITVFWCLQKRNKKKNIND